MALEEVPPEQLRVFLSALEAPDQMMAAPRRQVAMQAAGNLTQSLGGSPERRSILV